MALFRSAIAVAKASILALHRMSETLDQIKVNQGLLLAELHKGKRTQVLTEYEYGVFSQWGEDGIIQHLIDVIPIKNKTFIEFGVEDFFESNCRYLLMKDNWSGFVIDSSAGNIRRLKESYFYWKYDLVAIDAFITKDNINELLAKSGFSEDIGILSIDLDGNDYHILAAIDSFRPRLLICEYNAVFGGTRKISVPYDMEFARRNKHHSNLYFGASIGAITQLANRNGYSLVGTNRASSNAFFVRNDLLNEQVGVVDTNADFKQPHFRESRDTDGHMNYIAGDERARLIHGLPVLNVETDAIESF